MSFLPSSNRESPPKAATRDPESRPAPELDSFIPEAETVPYDMIQAVKAIVDDREVFELHAGDACSCGEKAFLPHHPLPPRPPPSFCLLQPQSFDALLTSNVPKGPRVRMNGSLFPSPGVEVEDNRISCPLLGTSLSCLAEYAKNIITCFARLGGETVGVVANQPLVAAGCLDIDASIKVPSTPPNQT